MIVADVCELPNKAKILVVANRYSGWAWAYDLKNGGESKEVIKKLMDFYRNHDKPKQMKNTSRGK